MIKKCQRLYLIISYFIIRNKILGNQVGIIFFQSLPCKKKIIRALEVYKGTGVIVGQKIPISMGKSRKKKGNNTVQKYSKIYKMLSAFDKAIQLIFITLYSIIGVIFLRYLTSALCIHSNC
ncbi:MAG: hypothetical protein GXX10_10280 [Clostridiaceae bacterium]|nr:hypothetical protein [Clostridiaceae bacterium]